MTKSITVENLSKLYKVGVAPKVKYKSLRDTIGQKLGGWFGGTEMTSGADAGQDFWALNDVSFTVDQGERLGIIGKNGAGKSTLLKIISRITAPTSGSVEVRGRLSSLLEVGTGFHPELTGRENIYLSGAVHGMSRSEIKGKFDEIVDFSEVEYFLDTPVKRYSSGMYTKLAFSVSAFLEPDILVLDEVLSVGDAAFQKKSRDKMLELSGDGRTVIFVSHSMSVVSSLCTHGIVLDRGCASNKLPINGAVEDYLKVSPIVSNEYPVSAGSLTINCFDIKQSDLELDEFQFNRPIDVIVDFEITKELNDFSIGIHFRTPNGDVLFKAMQEDWCDGQIIKPGCYSMAYQIPKNLIVEGNFNIELHAHTQNASDFLSDKICKRIKINRPQVLDLYPTKEPFGWVVLENRWNVKKI